MIPAYNIIKEVAASYDLSVDDINGRVRTKDIAEARQATAYLLRIVNRLSYPAIGRFIGRDHTTVIHACKQIEEKTSRSHNFKEFLDGILERVGSDSTLASSAEVSYNLRQALKDVEAEPQQRSTKPKIVTAEDYLNSSQNLVISTREQVIISKYRQGFTLEEIATEIGVSRERVRQLVIGTLIKELAQKAKDEGINFDINEYLAVEKKKHGKVRITSEAVEEKIHADLLSFVPIRKIIEKYGLKADKLIRLFPQFKERIKTEGSLKAWNRHYSQCRKCGTTSIPHGKYGYCQKCSGFFRGAYKEKLVAELGAKCSECGRSRAEVLKSHKDLLVVRSREDQGLSLVCISCMGRRIGELRRSRLRAKGV